MVVPILIITLILIIILIKTYFIKYDTVVAFTGGLGSGKSLLSVEMALKLLRINRKKVKRYNTREKIRAKLKRNYTPKYIDKPLLFSSIPLRISRKEWACELTQGHLLLTTHLPEKSIVFIDEIGSFASQFNYNLPNIADNFDEFVRLFRHYTKGGYIVCNDQCSENIVLQIRRRMNTVFNLMHFKNWFGLFYTVRIRNISISEEIKTVEDHNAEDNMLAKFGFMPLFFKHYDTYCYSERYNSVTRRNAKPYLRYKKNTLLTVPHNKVEKQVTNDEQTS